MGGASIDKHKTPLPTFLGIGGQKCASTWLSECLRYHPEVFMSSPKEVHFFDRSENLEQGLDWYRRYFSKAEGFQAVGEFTPNYLTEACSIEQIRSTLGSIKLIVLLRDPAERFISHYKHLLRKGELPKRRFRRLTRATLQQAVDQFPQLLANGAYGRPLTRYLEIFGASHVHIILKDDVDREPMAVVSRLFAFLDVDPAYIPPMLTRDVSPGIVPRFTALEAVRQRTYRLAAARCAGVINLMKKTRIPELYRCMNALPKGRELAIRSEVARSLREYYADDVSRLEQLLNRPLPWLSSRGVLGGSWRAA